jgi:predicted N-acetyltransferase YhbS
MLPADRPAVSALHAKVFGPGRFTRTAYRVRERGGNQLSRYCRLSELGGRLVAAVRFTPITIGGKPGGLLLGPLAVDPDFANRGFGRHLIGEALAAAKADGVAVVVLVGDLPYYGRFGFQPVSPGSITLPGPVNPYRLLAVELQPGALGMFAGPIAADVG